MKEIADLAVRMATENPIWGYTRIRGALKNLDHRVHCGEIVGMDFFTTEVWTVRSLKTYHVLFLLNLQSRRFCIAGVSAKPNTGIMANVARAWIDPSAGFLRNKRLLICDRDSKFTAGFKHRERNHQGLGNELIRSTRDSPSAGAGVCRKRLGGLLRFYPRAA